MEQKIEISNLFITNSIQFFFAFSLSTLTNPAARLMDRTLDFQDPSSSQQLQAHLLATTLARLTSLFPQVRRLRRLAKLISTDPRQPFLQTPPTTYSTTLLQVR